VPKKGSFRGALPVLVTLLIWAVGGWLAWCVGISYGWTQDSVPVRTGTMQVANCHRDPGHGFMLFACRGETTLAPESEWRYPPERLRGRTITLLSRTDLTGRNVPFFTSIDGRSAGNERWWKTDPIVERGFPDEQRRGSLLGPTLWVPLAWFASVIVAGIVAFPITLRLTGGAGPSDR